LIQYVIIEFSVVLTKLEKYHEASSFVKV
jgi:hypothetical protein